MSSQRDRTEHSPEEFERMMQMWAALPLCVKLVFCMARRSPNVQHKEKALEIVAIYISVASAEIQQYIDMMPPHRRVLYSNADFAQAEGDLLEAATNEIWYGIAPATARSLLNAAETDELAAMKAGVPAMYFALYQTIIDRLLTRVYNLSNHSREISPDETAMERALSADALDMMDTVNLQTDITNALENLPEPFRTIAVLRLRKVKQVEIARVLGCSESKISRDFQETLDRLRRLFEEEE